MKLSQINYQVETPAKIEIKDPETGLSFDKPAFIHIYSLDSAIGRNASLNIYRAMLEAKEKEVEFDKKTTLEIMATLIHSFEGIEDEKGKEIKCTDETKIELLKNDIIYKLVDRESGKLANFKA